ncbi:MAG: DUF2723 domain-containing protein [Candidatus Riflebacteria bacterium]|nr:DUF2723 domain-containing protein [Candidatus Riflebacteria bacterium]
MNHRQHDHSLPAADLPWILAAVGVALVALLATMAPGLTWEHFGDDGGELTVAVATLGVPHPSGYPLYVVLGWLFCQVFGVLGPPAFCTNLLSVVAGAAAAGAAVAIDRVADRRFDLGLPGWAAAILGLTGTLGYTFWSQAVITEVYVLHTALSLWTVAALVRWHEARRTGRAGGTWLWAAGLLWGLALGVHLTAGFLAPGLALLLLATDKGVIGRRPFWYALLTCVGTVIALYALLPLLATRNAPVNWGYIRTWDDLVHHVSGAQYRFRMFVFSGRDLLARARDLFWPLLARQWGTGSLALLGVGVGWGLWATTWGGTAATRSYARRVGAAWFLLWLPTAFYSLNYQIDDLPPYFTTTFVLLGLLFPVGVGALARWTDGLGPSRLARRVVIGLACLVPLAGVGRQVDELSLRGDRLAGEYGRTALAAIPRGSLVVSDFDGRTNALLYERWLGGGRGSDVAVILRSMLATRWYRDHLRRLYPDRVIPEPAPWFANSGWDPLCDHVAEAILRQNATAARFLVKDTQPFARNWRLVMTGGLFRLTEKAGAAEPRGRGRFQAVDLVPFANADYRGDPFLPGLRDGDHPHYPALGEGEMVSPEGIPFWLASPRSLSGRASVITTCYLADFRVRVPLPASPAAALHLVVAGGVCREASGPLAFVQPWYADGPGDPVSIAGLPDYRDVRDTGLRYWKIPLGGRSPAAVEIASGRAVTPEPFVPGVVVLAMTLEGAAEGGSPPDGQAPAAAPGGR